MRSVNFSAGPSMLPEEVLLEIKEELLDYQESGMSVIGMSHRSKLYEKIIDQVRDDLRRIANISDDYEILFLQGGASMQFSMVPMNLMVKRRADYVDTGVWSSKSIKEARLLGDVKVLFSGKECNYSRLPDLSKLEIRDDIDYLHITENNTIYGTEYKEIPALKDVVLVNDASSNILSRPIDISKFGLVYAGAQKNLGLAGLTLVIIRKDLIREDLVCPSMLNYKTHSDKKSMFNTPPTFAIYVMGKIIKWIEKQGGLEEMDKLNKKKADLIYDYLDSTDFYKTYAAKEFRSRMNVTFSTKDESLDKKFIEEASRNGLVNLKGHRDLGGLRASIYNAMPYEGVEKLVDFMKDFERDNR